MLQVHYNVQYKEMILFLYVCVNRMEEMSFAQLNIFYT